MIHNGKTCSRIKVTKVWNVWKWPISTSLSSTNIHHWHDIRPYSGHVTFKVVLPSLADKFCLLQGVDTHSSPIWGLYFLHLIVLWIWCVGRFLGNTVCVCVCVRWLVIQWAWSVEMAWRVHRSCDSAVRITHMKQSCGFKMKTITD